MLLEASKYLLIHPQVEGGGSDVLVQGQNLILSFQKTTEIDFGFRRAGAAPFLSAMM